MKISKKDQSPYQIDEDRRALEELSKKKCQHFAVGTFVMMNNQRAEILHRNHPIQRRDGAVVLTVRWEDGRLGVIKPFALNR